MKRIFTIAAALLMTASVWAQAPEKMSYQAVVRDASNALVTTTAVGMQISILQTTATGTAVYVETQTPTTNINGLVSLEIGSGTVVFGTFSSINWSNGPYFIKTETDPTGGTTYTITGTTQLMSVPYALHSNTADNIVGGITETDPTFTASEAANITATDITNLSNLSGTNTGDQTVITAAQATAITANTAKVGVTTAQATILGNTSGTNTGDQTVITTAQANAITVNTAKVGVTTAQATILGNTSGTNTGDQTVITAAQATAITANTAKVGVTPAQATILGNTSGTNTGDQTVITTAQANAITVNTAKVGVTTAQATILGNTSGTNTGDQTVITTAQANAITVNTAKVGVTTAQATILGNTSGTNTGDQTISRAGTTVTLTNGGTFTDSVNTYTSGIGIDITNNEISTTEPTYTIGLNAALGGYVFYVTLDGKHGLVAETQDQTTSTNWYTAQDIISDPANHSTNGQNFTDWRLPTKYELNQMYLQRVAIGGFAFNFYWSSSEDDSSFAWNQNFIDGNQYSHFPKYGTSYVRAVRAF
jgi:hypothetical protein